MQEAYEANTFFRIAGNLRICWSCSYKRRNFDSKIQNLKGESKFLLKNFLKKRGVQNFAFRKSNYFLEAKTQLKTWRLYFNSMQIVEFWGSLSRTFKISHSFGDIVVTEGLSVLQRYHHPHEILKVA